MFLTSETSKRTGYLNCKKKPLFSRPRSTFAVSNFVIYQQYQQYCGGEYRISSEKGQKEEIHNDNNQRLQVGHSDVMHDVIRPAIVQLVPVKYYQCHGTWSGEKSLKIRMKSVRLQVAESQQINSKCFEISYVCMCSK